MKTITIVAKDYTGLVADITELLDRKNINISAINADLIGSDAFIRLETDQYSEAMAQLHTSGYSAMHEDCILVRVIDQPGALAKISRSLAEKGIDIRGIHMVQQNEGFNIVAINSNNDPLARIVLSDVLIS